MMVDHFKDLKKRRRRLVHIPMGRFGGAHEIAQAALRRVLLRHRTTFLVDGGITAAYVTPEG